MTAQNVTAILDEAIATAWHNYCTASSDTLAAPHNCGTGPCDTCRLAAEEAASHAHRYHAEWSRLTRERATIGNIVEVAGVKRPFKVVRRGAVVASFKRRQQAEAAAGWPVAVISLVLPV